MSRRYSDLQQNMSARPSPEWSIPLHGPLMEGEYVRIGWPEEPELDAITALRNRADVRRQFLDPRVLDVERNRDWLRSGMNRPYEAVLSIRMKHDGAFIGAIGWSKGDPVERSLELGRIMVDTQVLLRYSDVFPADYPGIAVDAGTTVRDFAFGTLGIRILRMVVIESNRLSRRAAVVGGARVVGTRTEPRGDGREIHLIDLECNRDDWLAALRRAASEREANAPDLSLASSPAS
jgi:RimJ/RimL family protein N-acetyltransferase